MKRSLRGHALTSLAILAAAAGGYFVGIHDSEIAPPGRTVLRRVVAKPGDRIEVRKGIVLVNGKALQEPGNTGR
jgi:hypothetical protein